MQEDKQNVLLSHRKPLASLVEGLMITVRTFRLLFFKQIVENLASFVSRERTRAHRMCPRKFRVKKLAVVIDVFPGKGFFDGFHTFIFSSRIEILATVTAMKVSLTVTAFLIRFNMLQLRKGCTATLTFECFEHG